MKNINKIYLLFFFAMLAVSENAQAQSKTSQAPVEEKKEKKISVTDTKENAKSLDTKSDEAWNLYLSPPVAPNQTNNAKNNEKPKQTATEPK